MLRMGLRPIRAGQDPAPRTWAQLLLFELGGHVDTGAFHQQLPLPGLVARFGYGDGVRTGLQVQQRRGAAHKIAVHLDIRAVGA